MSGLPEHPSRDHPMGNRLRWAAGVVRYALDLRAQRDKAIAERDCAVDALEAIADCPPMPQTMREVAKQALSALNSIQEGRDG